MALDQIVVASEERLCQLIDKSIRAALSDVQRQKPSEDDSPPREYLNESQLRKLLGISHATVHRLRTQSKLPFLRMGSRILYDADEVRRAMEGQTLDRGVIRRRKNENKG